MRDYFNEDSPTRFIFPIDGDCVNAGDGKETEKGTTFTATVSSKAGCEVTVNGIAATESNGIYKAEITVCNRQTELVAKNLTDGTEAAVSVFRFPEAMGKYRISSDDNILFLADITYNKDKYTSIFDNPYLSVYKKAHDLYGAKIHLNVFYEFDREAAKAFSSVRPDFNLSMVTDKFKAEWEANSDWLKLAFHSRKEFPPRPYLLDPPETIIRDFKDVEREVIRFAGEKTFSGDVTTIHYGSANAECVAALRDLGHKALTGYFELNRLGNPSVSYYASIPLTLHVGERDFFVDTEMGIAFGRIDRVTNLGTLDEIMEDIKNIIAHPHRGGFVSFMIHEQYFYEDCKYYLPDFEARVLEPARLLWENGYTGAFIKEIIG